MVGYIGDHREKFGDPHRRPARARRAQPLVHHRDRGVQYLSIRYTERLAQAGVGRQYG
jgi:transposase InsO family protein